MKKTVSAVRSLLLAVVLIIGMCPPAFATETVPEASDPVETLQADLAVAGGGGAGITAALRASQAGLDVIVIEQSDHLGGDLCILAGVIPEIMEEPPEESVENEEGESTEEPPEESAEKEQGETSEETQEGSADQPQPSPAKAAAEALDMPALLALYAGNAGYAANWLQEMGMKINWVEGFSTSGEDSLADSSTEISLADASPVDSPADASPEDSPADTSAEDSYGDASHADASSEDSAADSSPEAAQAAENLLNTLTAQLEQSGVTILTGTQAISLVYNDTGALAGIRAKDSEKEILIEAKAVLLATGETAQPAPGTVSGIHLTGDREVLWRAPEYGKDGGLMVNENLQVIDSEGKAADALYAAGKLVGGVTGTDTIPGAGNGWAAVSGKLAAECIAQAFGVLDPSAQAQPGAAPGEETGSTQGTAPADPEAEVELYVPGEYQASAQGMNGDVSLTVEFSASRILRISWENSETPEIGGAAIEALSDLVVEQQGIDFDAVAGATVSSEAFRRALMECLRQASVFG